MKQQLATTKVALFAWHHRPIALAPCGLRGGLHVSGKLNVKNGKGRVVLRSIVRSAKVMLSLDTKHYAILSARVALENHHLVPTHHMVARTWLHVYVRHTHHFL